jgi:hypothetical protein
LKDDPELEEQARSWLVSRDEFIKATRKRDVNDASQAWQRHYFKGEHVGGGAGPEDHVRRRRLKPPRRAGSADGQGTAP